MAEIAGVYLIKNLLNGKGYVGSSKTLKARLRRHRYNLNANKHQNKKLQNAWNKHGALNFEFLILQEVNVIELLIPSEQTWIDFFNSSIDGYNIRQKAEANYGIRASDETRLKLSEASKGRVFSKSSRMKISLVHKGKSKPKEQVEKQRAKILGRKPTEQERINKSLGMMGHKVSDECKRKIGAAHKGRSVPLERRIKISDSLKGKKQPVEVVEKRKQAMKNMPSEKLKAWREKLRITSTGRKRSAESIAKGWETRRANLLAKQKGEIKFLPSEN